MGEHSAIEWTNATVNFWWGCTKVGPGCDHCYAEALSTRFGESIWGQGAPRRKIKGAIGLIHRLDNDYADWAADHECRLLGPHDTLRRRVFIQSMSDLFDLEVPLEWFAEAWKHILACNRIDIQIVTKRVSAIEKRLAAIGYEGWPSHVGLIATVCNQDEAERDVPRLLDIKTARDIPWVGLSIEPLLGAIDLTRIPLKGVLDPFDALAGSTWCRLSDGTRFVAAPKGHFRKNFLDWIIVGGESGRNARPMHPEWACTLRDQCAKAGVPFLFKQWGEWAWAPDDLNFKDALAWGRGQFGSLPFEHHSCGRTAFRAGKKRAGRLLEGLEHNGFPEVCHA